MELRHLKYFVAVAEELNFTRAAKKLNIAQPPLSQQIRALEVEVGVTLLNRTKRHVEMTDAGQTFLNEARLALAQAQHSIEAARRTSRGEVGKLSIGFVPAADLRVLPRIIPEFRRKFPDVNVSVHSLTSVNQVAALRAGRIDVGILVEPFDFGLKSDQDFVVDELFRDRFVVAMQASNPMAKKTRIALSRLSEEPFILYRREIAPAYYDNVIMGMFREAGFSPKLSQSADHVQTILGLVASGLGVSVLPASVTAVTRKEIAYLMLEKPIAYSKLVTIYNRSNENAALREFLIISGRCAKEEFGSKIGR
jgi:DNA-binding transcriptional LysR family regulator